MPEVSTSSTLTDTQLDEIEARAQAATPEPILTREMAERVAAVVARREKRCPPVPTQIRQPELRDDGYRGRFRDLLIIVSECKESDGRWWRHASVSRRDRKLPTYDDLQTLHRIAMPDLVGYQLFMPPEQHIDLAGHRPRPLQVLHLWACISGPVTPDFSAGTGSI